MEQGNLMNNPIDNEIDKGLNEHEFRRSFCALPQEKIEAIIKESFELSAKWQRISAEIEEATKKYEYPARKL